MFQRKQMIHNIKCIKKVILEIPEDWFLLPGSGITLFIKTFFDCWWMRNSVAWFSPITNGSAWQVGDKGKLGKLIDESPFSCTIFEWSFKISKHDYNGKVRKFSLLYTNGSLIFIKASTEAFSLLRCCLFPTAVFLIVMLSIVWFFFNYFF